ncbi:MAG: 30S ribosomal protein S6 [Candidatus Eisenbacteria bacterium]|nr:30S ribosomal protein S6 [Candidatus Eisenbacteria bacterium]
MVFAPGRWASGRQAPRSAHGSRGREETGRRPDMARKYEGTFIFAPALEDAALDAAVEKVEGTIREAGGAPGEWDRWGKRRLSYEIEDQRDGHYTFLSFEADPAAIEKLEQLFRLDENILRHMIIVKEDQND